jgi:hypothetical protein
VFYVGVGHDWIFLVVLRYGAVLIGLVDRIR